MWKNKLILLNRADNTLFKIDYKGFVKYIKDDDKDKPGLETIKYRLPVLNGITARFSGACILPGEDLFLFTASVENTPDWINDREILGSYIGILDLKQPEDNKPVCVQIKQNNKIFPGKVESIVVTYSNESVIVLVGVIDNDNGRSGLVELTFQKTQR